MIEKFYLSQTEDQLASQISLRNGPGEAVFGTVLYLVQTRHIEQVRDIFLHGFKKTQQTSSYTYSTQFGLPTSKGSLIIRGGLESVSQKEGYLIFIFNVNFFFKLLVNVTFSLLIKGDIQCMFDRPQRSYCSQQKIQVNSCISQNDFSRPQYVNVSFINGK